MNFQGGVQSDGYLSIRPNDMNDDEKMWQQTLSGLIYLKLLPIASRLGKTVNVENKGGLYESYHFGDEVAHLSKRLADATVGESGGSIETYAEAWEYKRFSWWREVLDALNLPVILLDTPLLKLADDANIWDPEEYLKPKTVINLYRLNPSGDTERQMSMEYWVTKQIMTVLNPLLEPDFELKEYENQLRLCPKNDEAKRSLQFDNQVYENARENIQKGLATLISRYQEKQAKLESLNSPHHET